jgi:hypothetical protein
MDKILKASYYGNILTTLIPLLVMLPLSLLQFFGDNSGVLSFISLTCIFPMIYYFYVSYLAIKERKDFSILLSITFYFNFIAFMIAVLVAFNFIIIGGFLFGGDSPIGMDLEQSQAPVLILLGIFLIAISANGMYYLSQSKKIILSQPPAPIG